MGFRILRKNSGDRQGHSIASLTDLLRTLQECTLYAVCVCATICMIGEAKAEDPEWWADPRCMEGGASLGLRGQYAAGMVPPFRVAERNRTMMGPSACARLPGADRVSFSLRWDWLSDSYGSGEKMSGPGDVRLGTSADIYRKGALNVDLGWSVKLPDARDETELGTDETDVTLAVGALYQPEHWGIEGAVALGIWGNPLRFANQDDVVQLLLRGHWQSHGLWLSPSVLAAPESDRNPARIDVGLSARWGTQWYVAPNVQFGLSPASPDWSGGLELGWHAAPPSQSPPM